MYEASVDPEFGSTFARRLNQSLFSCRAMVKPSCNLVQHGRSVTSELSLSFARINT